jgi:hypothetical protein
MPAWPYIRYTCMYNTGSMFMGVCTCRLREVVLRLCTPYSIVDGRKYELVRLYSRSAGPRARGGAAAAAAARPAARRGVGPPAVRSAAERGQWGKQRGPM